MKPTYFPFTFMPESTLSRLNSFFKEIIVYQASQEMIPDRLKQMAVDKRIDIRVPVAIDEIKLKAVFKEYSSWAELHKKNRMSPGIDFMSKMQETPFFSNISVSRIKDQIKGRKEKNIESKSQKEVVSEQDITLNAEVFLAMAQEYDIQNYDISQDLTIYNTLEGEMFQELTGKDHKPLLPNPKAGLFRSTQAGSFMTDKRIKTWSSLALHDPDLTGLFITDSPVVLEELLDKVPNVRKYIKYSVATPETASLKFDSAYFEQINTALSELSKAENPFEIPLKEFMAESTEDNTNNYYLTIYVAVDLMPADFLGCFQLYNHSSLKLRTRNKDIKNTLIGLLH